MWSTILSFKLREQQIYEVCLFPGRYIKNYDLIQTLFLPQITTLDGVKIYKPACHGIGHVLHNYLSKPELCTDMGYTGRTCSVYLCTINRIYQWSLMQTEKSQLEGKRIMPETRFTEFPALSVDPRCGISSSASETNV